MPKHFPLQAYRFCKPLSARHNYAVEIYAPMHSADFHYLLQKTWY